MKRAAERRLGIADRPVRVAPGTAALLGRNGRNPSVHRQGRAPAAWRAGAGSADETARSTPLSPRAVAPPVGRGPARDRQFRHVVPRRAAMGHHLSFRPLGIEDPDGPWHRRRVMAVLARRARRLAQPKHLRRHHLRHGFRYHPGSVAGGGSRRQVQPHLAYLAPARCSLPSSAACCSDTARASPMAATSAPISAESLPAVCTAGAGWSRLSSATSWERSFGRCSASLSNARPPGPRRTLAFGMRAIASSSERSLPQSPPS